MEFEKSLEQIAKLYMDEGYQVLLHPQGDQLPSFARDFGVDVLASRGDERVLVQVKWDRAALEADPNVPARAGLTEAQPGWRYDLVILTEGDPLQRVLRGAREPSNEEIGTTLADVERMIQTEDFRAACVFAWAALEATMRRIARAAGLYRPKTTPAELLHTLYGNGIIGREDFDPLNQSYRVRTAFIHGLVPPAVDPNLIQALVRATRRLLAGNPDTQSLAS